MSGRNSRKERYEGGKGKKEENKEYHSICFNTSFVSLIKKHGLFCA